MKTPEHPNGIEIKPITGKRARINFEAVKEDACPKIPNDKTKEAIIELESGKGARFASMSAAWKSLDTNRIFRRHRS